MALGTSTDPSVSVIGSKKKSRSISTKYVGLRLRDVTAAGRGYGVRACRIDNHADDVGDLVRETRFRAPHTMYIWIGR